MTTPLSTRYRRAFITGASAGLGLAFTEMLLEQGVEVWGTSRDPGRLPVRERFHPVALELGDGAEAERAFLEAERGAGGFDLVINNAGFGVFGSFVYTDFSEWEQQWRMMLVNTARLSQAALRGMLKRRRGALVNIASLAGEFGIPYQAAYNSVKAGMCAFNESLMYELRDTGVIVIDFRPGDYQTDFEGATRRPVPSDALALDAASAHRMQRAWDRFVRMMRSCPPPAHAAKRLHRALLRGDSHTVRSGDVFQAVIAPFLARFVPLSWRRWVQEKYFGL